MEPVTQKYTGRNLSFEIIPFEAGDGFGCSLIHVKGIKAPEKGPVLLVHGAGVSASIFLAPVNKNIVQFLLEAGYDVWLENWRASIDFAPNKWTLDQAALYDHPAAVKKVVEITGAPKIKAIIHCQGSTSFMMSVVAGLVPQVSNIVSNAVSLHPVVPDFSRFKLSFMVPVMKQLTEYLNPQWGLQAPTLTAKMVNTLVQLTHHECQNSVCKQVSFTYGSGFPALWRHENLNEETHEWIKSQFASVPMTFYKQIARSVKEGHLMSVEHKKELPESFVETAPATEARISFFAGGKNLCFLPDSQIRSFKYFDDLRQGFHALRVLPDYSHLDVFIGKNADKDVFPLMLQELSVN
ncbi:MAG: alpha/beta fold hydrolase [Adhaeribacter sp.]